MHVVGIVLGFMALMVFVLALAGLSLVRLLRGREGLKAREDEAREAALIQKLNQELTRMEQRIEALETILLEKGSAAEEQSCD